MCTRTRVRTRARTHMGCTLTTARAGGLPMLIRLLKSPSEQVQRQAAKAVANLGVNHDNKELIAKAGGVEPLIALARGASVPVKIEAIAALANLAVNGACAPRGQAAQCLAAQCQAAHTRTHAHAHAYAHAHTRCRGRTCVQMPTRWKSVPKAAWSPLWQRRRGRSRSCRASARGRCATCRCRKTTRHAFVLRAAWASCARWQRLRCQTARGSRRCAH